MSNFLGLDPEVLGDTCYDYGSLFSGRVNPIRFCLRSYCSSGERLTSLLQRLQKYDGVIKYYLALSILS